MSVLLTNCGKSYRVFLMPQKLLPRMLVELVYEKDCMLSLLGDGSKEDAIQLCQQRSPKINEVS